MVGIAALTPPYDGSGCRSGESRCPPESPTKLQCIPRCFFAPLDVCRAECVAMVGIAALTPPYDGSGCRSGESRCPPKPPTKLQCIPRCFFAPLDVCHAGCVAMVGIAALTPPYDGSGCRSGESRCTLEPPIKLQCIPRASLLRSMSSAPDASRWWASQRSPHPTMVGRIFPAGEGGVFRWWPMAVGGTLEACPTIDDCGCPAAHISLR